MPKLKELDLSQWRLTPLYSAQGVFMGDSSLDALDLSGFDMTQNEACKLHRDWQFILQEQDAAALLQYACDHYSYVLYQPIFEFLRVE